MKVSRFLAVVSTAAVVALVAALVTGGGPSATGAVGTEAGTIVHVVERAKSDPITNGSPDKDRVGNIISFAHGIFDQANAKKVGHDQGSCIRTVVGKLWECSWSTFLKSGSLTVEGPYSDSGGTVMAITGGTGEFVGAKGEMVLKYRNKSATAYDFIYHLK
jgi:allene oxide cyclase